MPATIHEFYRSRKLTGDLDNPGGEIIYKVLGTMDEDEVYALVLATAPTSLTIDGRVLTKRTFEVDPEDWEVWVCTVTFQKQTLGENESSYQFETGGGSIHITHSKETVQAVAASGTPPNFYNGIGWNGRELTGCDIVSPVFNFSETHAFPSAFVSGAYKLALFRGTGKTNAGSFKGFAPGEVLFLGASGSKRGDENWEITFRFAASENLTGITVGGISGINKKGWEYLWLYFEDDVNQDTLVKKPAVALVERVYDPYNYALLGIGV